MHFPRRTFLLRHKAGLNETNESQSCLVSRWATLPVFFICLHVIELGHFIRCVEDGSTASITYCWVSHVGRESIYP